MPDDLRDGAACASRHHRSSAPLMRTHPTARAAWAAWAGFVGSCAGLVASGWAAAAHGSVAVDMATGAAGLLAGGWVAGKAQGVSGRRQQRER